ncbi:MAG: hypothetical protein ABSA30_00240 [Candidatus Aminicenantales bacterium]|jgi:hypothetical protein
MAILYAKNGPATMTIGQRGERTYRRTVTLKSDTPNETKLTILLCGLLPVFGWSPYPEDLLAICRNVQLTQNKDAPYFWTADCEWSTLQNGNPLDQQKRPDQRRPDWGYSFEPIQKFFPADLDGKKYIDTAGTPFDPAPARAIFVQAYTIRRYEAVANRDGDADYMNAYNSDAWQGAKPGEALIRNIAVQEVFEQNAWWHHCTYTVLKSPRIQIAGSVVGGGNPQIGAFDYEYILNAGPKFLDANGKPAPIQDQGVPSMRADRLDANGHRLAANADNVYLKFKNATPVDFGPLKLVPPY